MFDYEDGSCQCGGHAIKRLNKKTGHEFYGCSNFPECRNTENIKPYIGQSFLLGYDDILMAYYESFYDRDG